MAAPSTSRCACQPFRLRPSTATRSEQTWMIVLCGPALAGPFHRLRNAQGTSSRRRAPLVHCDQMKPVTRSFYEMAIQGTIEQIAANLDGALDLECLGQRAGLSPFHFHRVFRGMVGETPLELIRRLRMERAAWRLARSTGSITDIAFDAGYETHEAFTRAFRASYSTSPSGFRQRTHPRIEIVATCGVHYSAHGLVPAFIPRNSGGDTMEVEIKEMP